jgi:3'(2'), 5'-bisphosphate nucleotidase
MKNYARSLEAAVDAVSQAMIVCRHVQKSLDTLRAITKDDRSPVTIADFASQAVVAALLREHLGDIVLVGEESASFLRDPAHAAHLDACSAAVRDTGIWPECSERGLLDAIDIGAQEPTSTGFWTLDPIDGTKGFLRGEQYCISLAYIVGPDVVLGVLGCPNLGPDPTVTSPTGSLYHAMRGDGAMMVFDTDAATIETDIHHSGLSPDRPARLAESVESGHTRHELSEQIMHAAGPTRPSLRIDSQCKYAVVARGDADVYMRLPTKREYSERIWDHAAGSLIAQEAGCTITDIRGRPLDFSKGKGLDANVGILGAPEDLHARLLRAIAAHRPA